MKQQKKDDAVSPVVGVMLMLVITIIIAAVVAAFAGGISGDVEKASTITMDVTMNDEGLLLTCTGADDASKLSSYGVDYFLRVNHPNNLDVFTKNLNASKATSGYSVKDKKGIAFKPGNSIYYSFSDLCSVYTELNKNDSAHYKFGNNADCWTYGGSDGQTIGLPVKVQLVDSNGKVLATGTGKCTRTN